MINTQTQIDSLIDLAVIQRTELKRLVESLPQLRDHLSSEIERNLEEIEPHIRTELEQFVTARALDAQAKTSAELGEKIDAMTRNLQATTAARYSVIMAERDENANLLAKAEARIAEAASALPDAVKIVVADELSRFPRAGEIDQLRKEFAEPRGLNPRGRWIVGDKYNKLDLVSYNGDSYVSNMDGNKEKPSRSSEKWTLSAARGNGGGGGNTTTLTDLVPVPTDGQLLIGNGSGFVNSTLTAGTGISISNGAGSITINATDGNITLDDGTAAAPSLNFTNYPTTGVYSSAANAIGFATSGVSRATISSTGLNVTGIVVPTGSLHAAAGTVGNPSIAFNADQTTGLYRIAASNIGFAIAGAKVLDISATGFSVAATTASTSTTTGSLINAGGFGNAGKAYIGDILYLPNASPYIIFPTPGWSGNAQAYFGCNLNTATSSVGDYFSFNVPTGKGYSFAINASSVFSFNVASGAALTGNLSTTGDLTVSGGNVGIGTAAASDRMVVLQGTNTTGTDQFGLVNIQTFSSAATSSVTGIYQRVATTATGYTVANAVGVQIVAPLIGATSGITNNLGISVANQGQAGVTNAYGIDIAAQSGAATTNIGLRNAGTTSLSDVATITKSFTGTTAATALAVSINNDSTNALETGISISATHTGATTGPGSTTGLYVVADRNNAVGVGVTPSPLQGIDLITRAGNRSSGSSVSNYYGLRSTTTGSVALTSTATNLHHYGVYGSAASSTAVGEVSSNYGVYGTASGLSGMTSFGGYFTASGGSTNYGIYVAAGQVSIATATASTSTTTGALIVAGGVGVAGRVTAGSFSSPSGTNTERFGAGASTGTSTNSIAVGTSAAINSSASALTAVGYNAVAGSAALLNDTAVGANSSSTAGDGTAIGSSAVVSGQYGVAVGRSAVSTGTAIRVGSAGTAVANSIAIGYSTSTTATGQIFLGTGNQGSEVWLGAGYAAASGYTSRINGTQMSSAGTGGVLYLAGGKGGDAASTGGAVVIQTASAGTGTTLADRLTIAATGAATFSGLVFPQQATTAGAPTYVKGGLYFDTTLNKLRVGGATAWETVTSV